MTSHQYQRPQIMNESGTTQAIRDALAAWAKSEQSFISENGLNEYLAVCYPGAIAALLAELDKARAGIEAAVLAERERCAVICDEMQEHWCAYKDTAQLNGDIALSIAASGEPRAAEALAALIRTGGIREGVKS